MIGLDKLILQTFIYEENTIFHVENYLKSKGIHITRDKVKLRLYLLLQEGFLKLYDDPSTGKVNFNYSKNELQEDYWFVLTDKGKVLINLNYKGEL